MRAMSMKWPYVTFQGIYNSVVVINATDRNMIHRIEFDDEWDSIDISATYITDTNDLFVMVAKENHYNLYMIDLDASNLREREDSELRDALRLYSPGEPILEYHKEDVDHKKLIDLHVRGSSRKEKIGSNHICQVFI